MISKGYIESKQASLWGARDIIGFGADDFSVVEIERDLANKIIVNNHYSHKYYNASYIHLGVFSRDTLHGVLQYGYAMNPASQNSVVSGTGIKEYLELNRMWLDDILPRNSESRAISYSIKYIKRKFPKIKWIQSFADERCGRNGIVYQASNFGYYGEHTSIFWEWRGSFYHNTIMTAKRGGEGAIGRMLQKHKDEAKPHELRQFRYLYFPDKKAKSDCLLQECPYPKHYQEAV